LIDNEKQYFLLRKKLAHSSTTGKSKANIGHATTNINTDDTNDIINIRSSSSSKTATIDKANTFTYKLFIHYTHEKRFHSFKRDMHKLYADHFGKPSAMNIKLVVSNRNRPNARHELIRKRPQKSLLQDKPIQSNYIK
jgi:hypothetical protein